ncbi:MAG TPA: hypothetical protein PKY50_17945 [Candidatus Competibacter sp.]|nr:hypothetical protein [Candidatus Competibacter sp.]
MKLKLISALVFSCVTHAHATTLLHKNLDDLSAEAENIVVGTVAKTESTYGTDKSIYTFVTIADIDSIKGQAKESELVLRFNGGQVGEDIHEVVGSPYFKTNEKVVLFVRGNGRSLIPLVGWTQGVFRVVADQKGGNIVTDNDGNILLGMSGKNLVKEHRFESETHVLDQGFEIHESDESTGSPGVSDDGQPSVQIDQKEMAVKQPLSLNQFVGDIKTRVAAAQSKSGNSPANSNPVNQ